MYTHFLDTTIMPTPPADVVQDSTSTVLRNVFQLSNIHFPIDAFSLLRLLISHTSTSESSNAGESKQPSPHLKLSDIKQFEAMLEQWSEKWEHGRIAIMKNRNQSIGPGACEITVTGAQVTDWGLSRKRKRGEEDVKTGALPMLKKGDN
jgi:hypothetical protein